MNNSDRILIDSIRSGNTKARYSAIEEIYKLSFLSIRNYVQKNNGANEDAKDVFQDGMTILYKDILELRFREECSLKTYLFSICKNLWLQRLKKISNKSESLDVIENLPDDYPQFEININALKHLISEVKEDCQKLLICFYYERRSMKEIMEIFQLGSEQVARTKKLRCMESMIKIVKEKGMTFENFLS